MSEKLRELLTLVDAALPELVELHQELIRIPTVNTGDADSGNEAQLCEVLEEKFAAEGIASDTHESRPGRANLFASLGPGDEKRLLLMSHTDVVPVEEESKWSYPPFAAVQHNGRIYGRGSDDAKSLVSTGAMSLILLKRAGVDLSGEVRFLAAADEEAGGEYGIAWLAKNLPQELRADWALNEGGGAPLWQDERLGYLLACGEKGRLEAHFTCRGQSGHAARPWASANALQRLASLVQAIEDYEPQVDSSHPVFDHLDWFGVGGGAGEDLDRLLQEADVNPSMSYTLKASSRMTVTPTMASAGIKSNSIPASARLTCDIRTLPWQDEAYVRQELDAIIKDLPEVEYELVQTAVSNDSPFDAPFTAQLHQAMSLALDRDDVTLVPALTVGFTDSRYVRPLGTDVYGFAPLTPEAQLHNRGVHGVDEFTEIETLRLRTRLNVVLAYLLFGGGAAHL